MRWENCSLTWSFRWAVSSTEEASTRTEIWPAKSESARFCAMSSASNGYCCLDAEATPM